MIAMLLAGGQGSRLGVLTQKVAKPAVSFGGKYRIIDFPLSNCINSGVDTVGVLTQYQPLRLNAHIGIGIPWDLDRNVGGVSLLAPYESVSGSDWYSGTANAIFQNLEFIDTYNPDYVDFEIEHWSDLLRPELKGHVMVLDGDGDDWVIGCLLAGEDSDDIENVDIEAVRSALMELKGQLLGFWASNDEQLIPWYAGDFWAGEIWSGPYTELLASDKTNIKLVHPEEGTVGYIDYWAVVEGTDEFDLACEWINWIESEEVQYTMATGESDTYPGEYLTYTPVNGTVIENLTPEQKVALELDPMPTCIKLLPYIADPDLKDQWTDLYQEFVG